MRLLLVTAIVCAAAVDNARGQDTTGRSRQVRRFDFDERPRNPYTLPEHWFAIGRDAKTRNPNFLHYPLHRDLTARRAEFPHYAHARFDNRHHTSGSESFYLGLNGGSAGAFLEYGAVSAVENSDYMVTARVRTTSLKHARARLVAYFIDTDGRKIDASESSTPLIQTSGAWQTISVKLFGDFPAVAGIGMQIELRQQRYDPDNLLGQHQIVSEELTGGAWFDDIVIWQMPRLVIQTQSDVNIVRAPMTPQLSMRVIDLTGRPLTASVTVHDSTMRRVAALQQHIGPGSPPSWQWRPQLTRFGWYLVDMQVRERHPDQAGMEASDPMARMISSFLWLPEQSPMQVVDAPRFGIAAEDIDDRQLRLMPELMEQLDLNALVLSAWSRRTTTAKNDGRQALLDHILNQLLRRRRQITISLNPLPDELAGTLDIQTNRPIAMFGKPIDQWRSYLAPLMMHHAQRVHHWQIDSADSDDSFFHDDFNGVVSQIVTHLRNMAPEPRVVLPWPIHQQRQTDLDEEVSFALHVPFGVRAEQLGDYLEQWTTHDPAEVVLNIQIPPASRVTHGRRINDLVLRMLYAWEAGAGGIRIERPWTVSSDRHPVLLPDPILGVFTSVAHQLAGREVVGRLPLDVGLRCMIFDGPAGSMLAAWNKSADPQDATIRMHLGDAPVAIDVWGNRDAVPEQNGEHLLTLGKSPIFIEGIDPQLALFRAGFRLVPPFIESKQVIHDRHITISNPWPKTITGHMTITTPENWTIQPEHTLFAIASGQTRTVPITMRFPLPEVAGHKKLGARFEFMARRKYVVDLNANMELGLPDVKFDANLSVARNPRTGTMDAIVTALITNKGDKMLSLRSFAIMRGYKRQMFPISQLKPGQSIVRQFRFEDGAADINKTPIRAGLRELDGPAVLNVILSGDQL